MSAAAVKKPTTTKPPVPPGNGTAGRGFKAMAAAAVAAQPIRTTPPASASSSAAGSKNPAPGSPQLKDKDPKAKVTRHVDSKVAARNNALNAMGGVKVDVFVRVRPKQSVDGDDKITVVASEEAPEIILEDPAGHPAKYTYDKVYGESSTQEQIYEDSVAPIVEQVCRGLSCAIFAYGQTGAGKTYTMRGDLSNDPSKQGIIQRSVLHLFKRLQEHDYTDVKVSVSFLEIYNEDLEDLFVDKPKETPGKPAKVANKLTLVDDPQRGSMCNGLTELPVSHLEEVMTLLSQAEARCKFSETKMNKMSNRAHRIFTIICNFRRYDNPVLATLTFVDLAGSEDISKSGAKGLTAREASHINKSLLTLGRVINALACNEKHIPYRDSKLTRLLSEALGGVCKTSFIACVSPCASSMTESNSTLRYAERAMEALNISQLPRWKQDEIMIDGLTRRVQQLTDELDSIMRIHYEEMTEMKNQRDSLAKENKTLKHQLGKARRKIDRLQARKGQLKTGLALMTQNRDVLQSQKDALVAELVETRKVRDGYLQDRNTLCTVLNSVRAMRNRLLSAHSNTENLLTTDALALKKTIEGAIGDIDDLHGEVARKKGLSSFNETLADDFRDRMSSKLRTLVQSISEFKVGQDDAYSQIQQLIAEQRSVRQKETSGLRSDVSRTATTATNLLNDIAQFAAEVESAYKSRLAKGREMSESNKAELDMALVQMRTNVTNKLEELRSHATNLDENLTQWAEKIKLKLEESSSSADSFGKNLTQHIAAVQAHLEGASNAQLVHFDEHVKQLQTHMETERAAVNDEAQRVINEMAGFVQRLISDHASKAILRSERAVAAFTSSVESLGEETKELVAHQTQEHNAIVGKTTAWNAAFAKSIEEGQRANSAMQFTGKGILKKVVVSSQNGEQDLVNGVAGLSASTAQHLQGGLALYKEFDETTEKNTAQYRKLVGKGTTDLQAESKKIGDTLHLNAEKYDKAAGKEKKHLETMHETVRQSIEAQTDDLFDAEADAVKYVTNDIKRDTKDPPGRKKYVYPQQYAATPGYPVILKDTAKEWEREAGINEGKLVPGQGPDFAGQKGPEDTSGIVATFKNKPPRQEEQEKLDIAAHESAPEEYSSGEEEKDENQEGAEEGAEEGAADDDAGSLPEEVDV